MKRKNNLNAFIISALVAGLSFVGSISAQDIASDTTTARSQARPDSPQSIFAEDFNYPAAALLVNNGWAAHSGAGTNSIAVVSPGLTYSGYPSAGNAVTMTTSGEDVNRAFATQSAGSVYASVLVNITDAAVDANGGYFFHLGPDPVGTTFRGRLYIKKDATNNISFGITKAGAALATDVAYTPFTYALNTTYLLVIKYTIVAGATNDTVDLFVNPTLGGAEPAATISAPDVAGTDINPGSVALRQGTAATSPTVKADGIRVSNTWASLLTAPPSQHVVDFNGDGKSDFAVVRNTGGGANGQITWFINYGGTGTTVASAWGLAGDFFVPVDYDGDQKTDIAIWRAGAPTVAAFYILQSATNTVRVEAFGQTGDDPSVVGDYSGDGKADLAVYRAGANAGDASTWFYRATSGGPVIYTPWGQNGDFPAPGDYDGDGKSDFVVQRNNGGGQARFWMNQTSAGFNSIVFGTPTDVIVPGDYDGDGKTDIAVVRGSAGQLNWYIRPSSTGVISGTPTAIFGASATDFPTHGDYDGDGKTDVAIWRPSATPGASLFWYQGSASGPFGVPFGQNGDYPVANYNRH